jgi:hypothetical protein
MRARIRFTTDSVKDTLVGILKEHHWWPHFDQTAESAKRITQEVQDSVEDSDAELYGDSEKIVFYHSPTDSKGTLSFEHSVWVVRILNPNIHLLQRACETFVTHVVDHATRNNKKIMFTGSIQIVEQKRKETIIEGRTLATQQDRCTYARTHKHLEFFISKVGVITLISLLLFTFPWSWRNLGSVEQSWIFSVFEKFIGSVAVTTLISFVQYKTFLNALRDYSIHWSIPGEPESLDVKPHG